QFKATKVPLIDIARELQVRYILQGSVRQSFENIRVNVQLVDTKSNQEIWAHRFDDNIENIFKLQDQIITKILNKLNLDTGKKTVSKRSTSNIEAYDYFLRAEHRRLNARGSKSGFKILEFYRRAIELDPLYVAAYTGLAREALTNWQLGDSEVMPATAWKKLVYESAGKALELDSKNTDALGIIGLLQAISGEHDAGIASVKSAVAINPSNPQLHADLAAVLSYGGSHDAALQSINAAIDRHATPPSAYLDERSRIYFFLGQFEKALIDAESDQNISDTINFSVFIHGALNNRELAQRFVGVRLQARPWENQASYRVLFAYYRRFEDIEKIIDSAARAGMPRFAYGFDPGTSKPLDNIAISKLTSAGPWQGNTHDGSEFYQQFTAGNGVTTRTADSTMSGAYHIENNKLCIAPQSVVLDLADCGYIYPVGADNSYTWVTLDGVYRFSVE
ncbi:MAG: hypothetical protein O7F15_02430, partial [Gammaproteobacteria bacterium]|nr:hypothetical protein [Gammaproteobacteria bacterium]